MIFTEMKVKVHYTCLQAYLKGKDALKNYQTSAPDRGKWPTSYF